MISEKTLLYHRTCEEVRPGDRVEVRRFLRTPALGTVIHVPGYSDPHKAMEYAGLQEWAIELDDGTVLSWPFLPEEVQPSKKIRLVSRGASYEPLAESEELR